MITKKEIEDIVEAVIVESDDKNKRREGVITDFLLNCENIFNKLTQIKNTSGFKENASLAIEFANSLSRMNWYIKNFGKLHPEIYRKMKDVMFQMKKMDHAIKKKKLDGLWKDILVDLNKVKNSKINGGKWRGGIVKEELDEYLEGFLSPAYNKAKQDAADRREDAIGRAVRINKIRKQREKQQRLNQTT